MEDFILSLDQEVSKQITLKNNAVSRITKITIDDGEQEAIYEILTTIPDAIQQNKENNFIYKKLVKLSELEIFLNEYYSHELEDSRQQA